MNLKSFVGALANKQAVHNNQMGLKDNGVAEKRASELEKIDKYEHQEFFDLILDNVYDNRPEKQEELARNLEDTGYYFASKLANMDEECLNDPEFSKALTNKTPYTKELGDAEVFVCNNGGKIKYWSLNSGDENLTVLMKALYVPSTNQSEPNRIRLSLDQQMYPDHEYPFIHVDIDMGDDGSLTYQPLEIDMEEKKQIDISATGINLKGLEAVQKAINKIYADAKTYGKSHGVGR